MRRCSAVETSPFLVLTISQRREVEEDGDLRRRCVVAGGELGHWKLLLFRCCRRRCTLLSHCSCPACYGSPVQAAAAHSVAAAAKEVLSNTRAKIERTALASPSFLLCWAGTCWCRYRR